jgi:hypothetical protein
MKAMAWSTGSGSYRPPAACIRALEQRLQRGAADVLHDDVAGALVGDEVCRSRQSAGARPGPGTAARRSPQQRVGVTGVEQALEDHPAVGDVAVAREIDPAEATVREAPGDLVLPPTRSPAASWGLKEKGCGTWRRSPRCAPGCPIARAANGRAAGGTGALGLRNRPGSSMIAAAASTAGIGGIVVRPAPSRAPRSRFERRRAGRSLRNRRVRARTPVPWRPAGWTRATPSTRCWRSPLGWFPNGLPAAMRRLCCLRTAGMLPAGRAVLRKARPESHRRRSSRPGSPGAPRLHAVDGGHLVPLVSRLS